MSSTPVELGTHDMIDGVFLHRFVDYVDGIGEGDWGVVGLRDMTKIVSKINPTNDLDGGVLVWSPIGYVVEGEPSIQEHFVPTSSILAITATSLDDIMLMLAMGEESLSALTTESIEALASRAADRYREVNG